MIVVIADDLTGAAEIGGLALRYDLTVEIISNMDVTPGVDVLVFATDTRSMTKEEAKKTIALFCKKLLQLKPRFVYKKVDSVLRGHILAEIEIEKELLGYDQVLLIPANPGLERTIENGIYLLNKKPIHLSHFSHDPEFPIRSSQVAHMLRAEGNNIISGKNASALSENGIVIGDVQNSDDLLGWVKLITIKTLVAGGAEFFNAWLLQMGHTKKQEQTIAVNLQPPVLLVSGSTFQKGRAALATYFKDERTCFIPENILDENWMHSTERETWINKIISELSDSRIAWIVIKSDIETGFNDPLQLRLRIAACCAEINKQIDIKEWLIEGGSTAASILGQLQVNSLYPTQELAPGVIRMGADQNNQRHFTLKPGSYNWPTSVIERLANFQKNSKEPN